MANVIMVVISVALFAFAAMTLWWTMHAWRTPETLAQTGFAPPDGAHALSFSLLVPARHEEAVLEHTVSGLLKSTHPNFEIVIIVGHDDPGTADVARKLALLAPGRIVVITDSNPRKNKPRALNGAIPYCRGEVVGVFDAEDQVHPLLLEHVDHAFRSTGADVVQGGVQLINFHSSWYSLHNCLEYFFWFRSRLHLQERHGFIPLGGNTVFVRSEVLRHVNGWDPECLAEDCELGVRLSALGATISVCYDPYLVTREETPHSIGALLKQRTRWNQGFLQVLRKNDWRRLPTRRQRMLARYTLAQPFMQAFAGIGVPLAIVCALAVKVPVGIALVTFLPALPTVAMVVFELVGVREFCRVYLVRPRLRDYVRLAVGTPFYQLMLAAAACRAVIREARGQRGWEKTAHSGAHRAAAATSN